MAEAATWINGILLPCFGKSLIVCCHEQPAACRMLPIITIIVHSVQNEYQCMHHIKIKLTLDPVQG